MMVTDPTEAAGVDPAAIVVFRVGFGLLATASAVRFVALGWVDLLLAEPAFHFTWVPGLPVPGRFGLFALFAGQALGGLALAANLRPRLALVLWLGCFVWVELIDKALYLNHHILFMLLGLCLLALPLERLTLRGPLRGPAWACVLLRVVVGSVYVWAGLAKLQSDWLVHAEPLRTWLAARQDLPWVGPLLALPQTAIAMSWAGAAYDLLIPFVLLWGPTRRVGLLLVVGFHVCVGLLFPIGIFPALMVLSATVFLPSDWPRRLVRHPVPSPWQPPDQPSAPVLGVLLLFLGGVCLFPGRFLLLGDRVSWTDVNWTEQGYRFAWRVMLNEKTGFVEYTVVEPASGRRWKAQPAQDLTQLQHKQMRTQPDLMRDYARHLAQRHAAAGRRVEVRADAWCSLNGRPAQRLLSPDVDLTQPLATLRAQGWILPLVR